jgi:hypothetical protein
MKKLSEVKMAVETRLKPVYCRDCKSQGSYERYETRDVLTEGGSVFLECWKCRICGHLTWGSNIQNEEVKP